MIKYKLLHTIMFFSNSFQTFKTNIYLLMSWHDQKVLMSYRGCYPESTPMVGKPFECNNKKKKKSLPDHFDVLPLWNMRKFKKHFSLTPLKKKKLQLFVKAHNLASLNRKLNSGSSTSLPPSNCCRFHFLSEPDV